MAILAQRHQVEHRSYHGIVEQKTHTEFSLVPYARGETGEKLLLCHKIAKAPRKIGMDFV